MEDLERILIELEERLFRTDVRNSSSVLAQLISDDFIEIGASGLRFGKANVLARLPTEVAPEITASNYELRMFGPGYAQLLYKAKMSKIDHPSPVYSHRCSVWRQNNSAQWQMIYHQGTTCAPF